MKRITILVLALMIVVMMLVPAFANELVTCNVCGSTNCHTERGSWISNGDVYYKSDVRIYMGHPRSGVYICYPQRSEVWWVCNDCHSWFHKISSMTVYRVVQQWKWNE